MNTIEQLLARVPVTEGFIGLHLVEAITGQVLASVIPVGVQPPVPTEALAATMTDAVQLLATLVTTSAVDEDLEDLVVTLTGHHHLVRPVPEFAGTDSFLLLTLDRARTDLATARRLLLAFEAGLVA